MKCSNCGNTVPEGEKFCSKCGSKLDGADENRKHCTNCGSVIENNSQYCPKCGFDTHGDGNTQNTKFCVNCGAKIDINAEICPKCGVRQMSQTQSDKSTFITLVLSFILPGLGHFYLGLTKKGIILLILGLLLSPSFLYGIGLVYLIVWGYGLYDSYKQSEALSRGENVEDW